MRRVITYGTFDLFHFGHLEILRRAKELGDYLIVAVSTDEFNAIKGKRCVYPFKHRLEIVHAIKYVDEVIPETSWEQKRTDISNHKVDVFTIGSDWTGKFDDLGDLCEVIYLDRTDGISTSNLIDNIENQSW